MIVKKSQDEIQNYLTDASNFKGKCEAVYIPESAEEISEILKEANKNKTHVTISGNGTGLTGARVPQDGIVLSTEKLNHIIEINTEQEYSIVEPAVILAEYEEILKEKKLLYPPDPTERNCYIGGTVATNASGEKTFKYGPTRDYVAEIEVILPVGEILNLKRGENIAKDSDLKFKSSSGKEYSFSIPDIELNITKNAAGYYCKRNMDAIDLFIGSEGTLGIITKIKVRLVPLPEKILSCLMFFDREKDSLAFIKEARENSYTNRISKLEGIDALALEYFDGQSLRFLKKDYEMIPDDAEAAVWFEQEVTEENEDKILELWANLIDKHNGNQESAWFAYSDSDNKKIQSFRHAISENVNEYITRNNFRKLGTDTAVPDAKFEEYYFYSKGLMLDEKMDYVIYGHAGNSHLHLNMLPKDEKEFEKGLLLYRDLCLKAINLGGTVSAEHGIGKSKTQYLIDMYGIDTVKKMAAIKKTLDPNLILGIGNMFDKKIF
jgi:D-lactate dehydrogenase (cytochrome)